MKRWNIYHKMREYSREMGDPILGMVWATTKQEAEQVASGRWFLPTGAWAVEATASTGDAA